MILPDEKLPPPPPYEAHENHGSSSRLPTEMPPSSSSRSAGEPSESPIELTRDAGILIRSYLPKEIHSAVEARPLPSSSLPLPLCLPQISRRARWDSPFARGYNEWLADLGIPQQPFLNFIDGLNLAIAASPPLRVVDITGKAIGYVPYHWAMISGPTILQRSASKTGPSAHVLSKTLTDRYLRAANQTLFHPKGLSVRICTTLAMENFLLRPRGVESSPGPSKLDKFGRAVGGVLLKVPIPIVGPLTNRVIRAVADKPPTATTPSTMSMSFDTLKNGALSRRLARTEGISLPVTLVHLPSPVRFPTGVVEAISSWGVRLDHGQRLENEAQRKTEKRRRALAAERMGIDLGSLNPGSDSTQRMWREYDREARGESRTGGGRSGGLLSLVLGPDLSPMESRVANSELLEHWADEKVLWVVVMSSENDKAIDDISKADEKENEERVDEKSWKKEMENEREILEENLDELGQFEDHDQKDPRT
ncbi:hypothetical protein E1B28_011705 [Marasmius oreades]|uniref:Uncharacterized protein n=1 Tax=Marasmius oreades TaxID=181124 RepID=A0A9P7RW22_9AGAR|nr:uncharacterized protein E1B28_011705 [Marasmius oreades]KAG7090088.1 hypothetical protein E1B28_011705 [Marasmius oreades]